MSNSSWIENQHAFAHTQDLILEEAVASAFARAQCLAANEQYQASCQELLGILALDHKKQFHSEVIREIDKIRANIQGAGLTHFERTLKNHPEGYLIEMIVSEDKTGLRGMSALVEATPGEVLIKIPLHELLTCLRGEKTAFGQEFLSKNIKVKTEPRIIFLIFSVLEDFKTNKHSILKERSYVEESMCHFWDSTTISKLEGSHLKQEIEQLQRNLEDDYRTLCQLKDFQECCSIALFKKLKAELDSKNFVINLDGRQIHAFVPIVDTINHSSSVDAKWHYNPENQCFEEIAVNTIQPGQVIWHSYGKTHANSHLLTQYGFTEKPSPHDFIEIDNWVRLYRTPTSDIAQKYWVEFVKIFSQMCDGNTFKGEIILCGKIYEACHKKINSYAHRIDQDQQWLAKNSTPCTEYFIRQLLFSEKKLAMEWIWVCQQVLLSLQKSQQDRPELIKSWSHITQGPGLYLRHIWSNYLQDENNMMTTNLPTAQSHS